MLEIHLADPQIEGFIREAVNDFTKLDIVLFFSRNRDHEASADEIARYTGRSRADVEKALTTMENAGLIVVAPQETCAYRLSDDISTRSKVEALLRLYSNITERLKIISILIQASE